MLFFLQLRQPSQSAGVTHFYASHRSGFHRISQYAGQLKRFCRVRFLLARPHLVNRMDWNARFTLLAQDYPDTPSLNRACNFRCTRLKAMLSLGWQPSDWVLADPANTRLRDGIWWSWRSSLLPCYCDKEGMWNVISGDAPTRNCHLY